MPDISFRFWGFDSGPYAGMASTLLTETSIQPHIAPSFLGSPTWDHLCWPCSLSRIIVFFASVCVTVCMYVLVIFQSLTKHLRKTARRRGLILPHSFRGFSFESAGSIASGLVVREAESRENSKKFQGYLYPSRAHPLWPTFNQALLPNE